MFHDRGTFTLAMLAFIFIMVVTLCTSCLCVVPGVNATVGCLPPGYSLYYTPQDQEQEQQGQDGAVYPYNSEDKVDVE